MRYSRAVEGSPAMAGQVFEKIGSQNLCEVDVFWSRISDPDDEWYDPMVTTAIMRL